VGTDLLREAVQKVERSLFQDYEDEVPSHAIGELVMESLHDIDKVAYVRFASVYRDFTSVEDFIQIVQSIDPFVPALAGKTFQGRAL
jgi:transcriptional repressor NrdR